MMHTNLGDTRQPHLDGSQPPGLQLTVHSHCMVAGGMAIDTQCRTMSSLFHPADCLGARSGFRSQGRRRCNVCGGTGLQ